MVAVISPARWRHSELGRARNLLVVNLRVVPVQASEVVAALAHGCVLNPTTVAAIVGVLRVDHPVAAGLGIVESGVRLNSVTGV